MFTQSLTYSSTSDELPMALLSPSDSELDADIRGSRVSVSSDADSMSTKMSAGKWGIRKVACKSSVDGRLAKRD